MIWLLMGILILAVLLFVTKPLYEKTPSQSTVDTEVDDYLNQIADIDQKIAVGTENNPVLESAKIGLQRGLISRQSKVTLRDTTPPALLLASFFVIFSFSTLGLYALLGRPELTVSGALQKPIGLQNNADTQVSPNMSLEQLVVRLEQRLQTNGDNLDGQLLLARSLMNLGQYDKAVAVYEKAAQLSNQSPEILTEITQAKQFIMQASTGSLPATLGPSAEDINAAAQMSATDRNAMIENMVEGLSQKLKDNPNDASGWIRLLRARRVLGQGEKAQAEIKRMRQVFNGQDGVIANILKTSGWIAD